MKNRKIKDLLLNITTVAFSFLGFVILISIMAYVLINGTQNLSWELLTSDYQEKIYNVKRSDEENYTLGTYSYSMGNEYFSSVWGIALIDDTDVSGNDVIKIAYIAEASPLKNMHNVVDNTYLQLKEGMCIDKVIVSDSVNSYYALSKDGAAKMIMQLNQGTTITDMIVKEGGGGIRGSIFTTILLIIVTLAISLPLGIGSAIYLHEYAPKNKLTTFISSMIDMIGGIPSIIFGFFGMFVFIPLCNLTFKTNGGSILSGSLTLSIMILPTVIKTVIEALSVLPDSYRSASLALGASKTQTVFKVILPNAISGILTATVLCIGRIIGESASLIFAIGTVIKDKVSLTSNGTSLAVQIWVLMGGEKPNFKTSCSIAIVIIVIVFILNIIVKLLGRRLSKYGG